MKSFNRKKKILMGIMMLCVILVSSTPHGYAAHGYGDQRQNAPLSSSTHVITPTGESTSSDTVSSDPQEQRGGGDTVDNAEDKKTNENNKPIDTGEAPKGSETGVEQSSRGSSQEQNKSENATVVETGDSQSADSMTAGDTPATDLPKPKETPATTGDDSKEVNDSIPPEQEEKPNASDEETTDGAAPVDQSGQSNVPDDSETDTSTQNKGTFASLPVKEVRADTDGEIADGATAFITPNAIDSGYILQPTVSENGLPYYDITDAENLAIVLENEDHIYYSLDHISGFVDEETMIEQSEDASKPSRPSNGRILWDVGEEGLDALAGDTTLLISTDNRSKFAILYFHRDVKEQESLVAALADGQTDVIAPDATAVRLSINQDCDATIDYADGDDMSTVALESIDGEAALSLDANRLRGNRTVVITLQAQNPENQPIELVLKVRAADTRMLVLNHIDGAGWDGAHLVPLTKDGTVDLSYSLLSDSPVEQIDVRLGGIPLDAEISDSMEAGPDMVQLYKMLTCVDSLQKISLHITPEMLSEAAKEVEIVGDRQLIKLSFAYNGEPVKQMSDDEPTDEIVISRDASRKTVPMGIVIATCALALIFLISLVVFIVSTVKLRGMAK